MFHYNLGLNYVVFFNKLGYDGVNSQLGDIYLSESIDQLGWKNIEHMR